MRIYDRSDRFRALADQPQLWLLPRRLQQPHRSVQGQLRDFFEPPPRQRREQVRESN